MGGVFESPAADGDGRKKHRGGRFATYRWPGSLILVGNAIVKPDQHQRGKKSNSDGTNS